MKEVLRKMFDLEQTNLPTNEIFPEGIFYDSFSEYVRDNSKLLKDAIIFQGKVNSIYGYDISENVNNPVVLLGNESFKPAVSVFKRDEFLPKSFGLEITLPHRAGEIEEETEKKIITQVIYKPLLKAIEHNCISGNYFHKSLFSTANTISGSGFNGILELARIIKNKTDNGMIIINSLLMESIINNMPTEYKIEFLMKNTIEGIEIIQTIDAPVNFENKIAIAFDRNEIVLNLVDEISIRKINTLAMYYIYQIMFFCNFSDLYSTAIALKME
jgi:hypothetical protein